jgi:sigma-B regulation protein RsbU (phosphoserine phosphatase)
MEPNAQTNAARTTDRPSAAPPSPPPPTRVLLVEDNPGDARLIREFIREADAESFDVERAERLDAALARLAQEGVDLVLLDLSLPDSHGIETFRKLHTAAPNVPTIVLSGLNDESVALQAVHDGAQDYLMKGQGDGRLLVRAMRYALERARTAAQLAAYAEELRTRNTQLEADLHMARGIQRAFLPAQFPAFPAGAAPEQSRLQFHHLYQPAAAVGGDFFSVFALSDAVAGVFICDVMGHGLRAALITAVLRGLVEELRPQASEPGAFLATMNRNLHAILRRTDETILATAFLLTVDLEAGQLRFANAGHPSPLHLRRAAGQVAPLKDCDPRHGPALGLFAEAHFPTCSCPVNGGDAVMLFTDGLHEAEGPDGEEFGMARMEACVRARLARPTGGLFVELLGAAEGFAAGRPFEDDVCLVGVDFAPVSGGPAGGLAG